MNNWIITAIKCCLILAFLTISSALYSQSCDKCNLEFINHLINTGDYEEALYILDSADCSSLLSNDSSNYFRGWSQYSLKRLSPSVENFLKVKPSSEFYLKSHFFAAYNYTHIGKYSNALETLEEMSLNADKMASLKNFELSGIYLLKRNWMKYEETFGNIDRNIYEISQSADNLENIYADIISHKSKSPLLAGALSGIVPGLGKFYSGKRGEAISAFITTTGLGFVTWENYRKSGPNSLNTIVFGTAFAFSYAANIYGAVITVNIFETEYQENVKNSILFNLHIPLRNTFDK